ncbi:MAG TPA: hypothetical protein VFU32_03240, partial [Ktedonobacterales bacterium]|nr:hypothetical protein [Ktedonobacterales bacterium]
PGAHAEKPAPLAWVAVCPPSGGSSDVSSLPHPSGFGRPALPGVAVSLHHLWMIQCPQPHPWCNQGLG